MGLLYEEKGMQSKLPQQYDNLNRQLNINEQEKANTQNSDILKAAVTPYLQQLERENDIYNLKLQTSMNDAYNEAYKNAPQNYQAFKTLVDASYNEFYKNTDKQGQYILQQIQLKNDSIFKNKIDENVANFKEQERLFLIQKSMDDTMITNEVLREKIFNEEATEEDIVNYRKGVQQFNSLLNRKDRWGNYFYNATQRANMQRRFTFETNVNGGISSLKSVFNRDNTEDKREAIGTLNLWEDRNNEEYLKKQYHIDNNEYEKIREYAVILRDKYKDLEYKRYTAQQKQQMSIIQTENSIAVQRQWDDFAIDKDKQITNKTLNNIESVLDLGNSVKELFYNGALSDSDYKKFSKDINEQINIMTKKGTFAKTSTPVFDYVNKQLKDDYLIDDIEYDNGSTEQLDLKELRGNLYENIYREIKNNNINVNDLSDDNKIEINDIMRKAKVKTIQARFSGAKVTDDDDFMILPTGAVINIMNSKQKYKTKKEIENIEKINSIESYKNWRKFNKTITDERKSHQIQF